MMRVLIVATNLKIAGAQKMIEQIVLHMDHSKYEVRVIVLSKRMGTIIEQHLDMARVDIRYLEKPAGLHISFFQRVRKEVRDFLPDIIHTHVNSWLYVLPSVLIDHFVLLHTIHSSPERQEANGILRGIIKTLYKTGRAIPVAISDKIREDAAALYKIPIETVERVYNPVDYGAFSSIVPSPHPKIVFVNVARFNAIKNQMCLIRAFSSAHAENGNISLVFAGDGKLLPQAKQLTRDLGCSDYVTFCGNVDDIPKLLSECDIFVLPSLSEGMPISLIEAEAAGMPIIASNVGGIPDVVDRNGILVAVNDEMELKRAMLKLAGDVKLREYMSVRSKKIAERYRADIITKEYEALYDKYGKTTH